MHNRNFVRCEEAGWRLGRRGLAHLPDQERTKTDTYLAGSRFSLTRHESCCSASPSAEPPPSESPPVPPADDLSSSSDSGAPSGSWCERSKKEKTLSLPPNPLAR